jgi:hypothetical protein
MSVNNSSRCWLEYTLGIKRTPLLSTSDKDGWVDAESGAASLGDACLTSRLVALAWRLVNTPNRLFPCALDAARRDATYRLSDMTRSMQTAPSHLTSSIPCRAGAGDNCH